MGKPTPKVGQEWSNGAKTVRVERVHSCDVVVGSVCADGSLARRRSMLISSLHKGYRLVKEAPNEQP